MRKKKLIANTIMALANQIISLLCGFILPRQILLHFGSTTNGLVTSISQFLGFIAIMDMGVGAVVQSALYKPLAENNTQEISEILASAKKFFQRIAIILIGYTLVLTIAFPIYFKSSFGYVSTALLVVAISLSSIAQYYFGLTNQLLLNADQKSYVQLGAQCIATILNTVVSVFLMHLGASINAVKFGATIALMARPMILAIYVNRKYRIDKHVVLLGEPIKQKWNGLAQHVATFIVDRTDVAVLTLMSTLTNVSIYYVYHLVVTGLYQLFVVLTSGIQSLLGDMYAKNEKNKLNETFSFLEWAAHAGVSVLFGCTIVLIVPFVSVYTKGITDAEYLHPLFGTILTCAFACYCLRSFYHLMIKAVGHYKETQVSAIIEAVLNITVSVAMVWKYGLVGVAIGTLIAVLYRLIYFAVYLKSNIIRLSFGRFVKYFFTDTLTVCLICLLSRKFELEEITYKAWAFLGIKTFSVALLLSLAINFAFYYRQISILKKYITKPGRLKE